MLHKIVLIFSLFSAVVASAGEKKMADGELFSHAKGALDKAESRLPANVTESITGELEQAINNMVQTEVQIKSQLALEKAWQRLEGVRLNNIMRQDIDTEKIELDINKLLNKYKQEKLSAIKNKNSTFYIFVSKSVPTETMKKLVDQAERANVPLIFRGFIDGSMKKTFKYIQMLISIDSANPNVRVHRDVSIMIDPVLFQKLGIERVPAFSVIKAGTNCIGPTAVCHTVPKHYTVYGDVSLGYAIESLRRLVPEYLQEIKPIENRLKIHF